MQPDGNLCAYSPSHPTYGNGVWCAQTQGHGMGTYAQMNDDGTFCVYDPSGNKIKCGGNGF